MNYHNNYHNIKIIIICQYLHVKFRQNSKDCKQLYTILEMQRQEIITPKYLTILLVTYKLK